MKNWHLNLVSCIAIVLAIGVSDVIGDPKPINKLVGSNSLSSAQQGQIEDYAKFHSNNLSSGDIQQVENSKRKLLEPLRAPSGTAYFRSVYAKRLVPQLMPVIDGDSPYAAVNALQVVAFIGTDEALRVIEDHINIEDEPSFAKRLWAIKGFAVAVDEGALSANQLNPILRQLGIACKSETEPMILRSQFDAISKVKSPIAREVLLGALTSKLERLAKQENPSSLMEAIYPALVSLRDQYLNPDLGPSEQKAFGLNVAPSLGKVFEVSLAHWDTTHLDAKAHLQYATYYKGANEVAEAFLKTIARKMGSNKQPPKTKIADAWKSGNKSLFEKEHKIWHDIITRPPFGG